MVDLAVRTGNSGIQSSGNILAVTPSDSVDLTYTTRAVYVGGTGDLIVITSAGQTVTFSAVPAGTILPICVNRIKVSGATNILALL